VAGAFFLAGARFLGILDGSDPASPSVPEPASEVRFLVVFASGLIGDRGSTERVDWRTGVEGDEGTEERGEVADNPKAEICMFSCESVRSFGVG
jgi:hypothetical protein